MAESINTTSESFGKSFGKIRPEFLANVRALAASTDMQAVQRHLQAGDFEAALQAVRSGRGSDSALCAAPVSPRPLQPASAAQIRELANA